jgi:opacity protein-like surface antigen
MKKVCIVLFALVCLAGFAFAADKTSSTSAPAKAVAPLVDKGNLLANVGIGWGGLSGGVEYEFARIDIGGTIPLSFGAAARAFVDPGLFYSWSTFAFGAGAFGTAHFSWKSVFPDVTFVNKLDTYAGLGVGFASATLSSAYSGTSFTMKPGVGISTFEGTSYYLNDKLAINFEYGYIGQVGYSENLGTLGTYTAYWPVYYSTIGVVLKL